MADLRHISQDSSIWNGAKTYAKVWIVTVRIAFSSIPLSLVVQIRPDTELGIDEVFRFR